MKIFAWIESVALGGLLAWQGVSAAEVRFFRSNQGVVDQDAGSLVTRLDEVTELSWKRPLDSGHSTPCVLGNRIFLTTFSPERQELATVCLDRSSGDLIWKQAIHPKLIEPYHQVGSPAAPTPATDGHQVFVFFGSYGVLCYDLDGQFLWDHPMGPFQDEFGTGSSPILAEEKVIICQDHDVDSFIMALDKSNGNLIWRTARPDAVRSYSTPILWKGNGKPQVVVAGALELSAYDLETGNKDWWFQGLARIVIPVPIQDRDWLYVASWAPGGDAGQRISLEGWDEARDRFDRNKDGFIAKEELEEGPVLTRFFRMDLNLDQRLSRAEWERHAQVFQLAQNSVYALKPEGTGDLTSTAVRWKYHRGVPYVASPVIHEGAFWMIRDGGIVTRMDASTGDLHFQERLPGLGSYYASPVVADGKVIFASEQGVVSFVAEKGDFQVLASHDFKERIYAGPVVDHGLLLIRTEKALYAYQGHGNPGGQ